MENLNEQPLPSGYRPRVIVKFSDDVRLPIEDAPLVGAASRGPAGRETSTPWQAVQAATPGVRVTRLFDELRPAQLVDLRHRTAAASGAAAPDLASFVALSFPPGTPDDTLEEVASNAAGWTDAEHAYVESRPAPPPVHPSDDPRFSNQGYLGAAPAGIDVEAAWAFTGGDGTGVGFVDLEQGWTLGHEDLSGAGVTLLSGRNQAFEGHGTAVLGVVLGQDNTRGGVGIVPKCTGRVVSEWRDAVTFSTPSAIIAAVVAMSPGDVLLLEAQRRFNGVFMPVEVELGSYVAILVASALGVIVVEAAGNGSTDLDNFSHPTDGFIFKRGHADFRDSGAIMVGSSNSAAPHARRASSNFGSRIDCYAWGQNIDTTDGSGGSTNSYRNNFSGTSGASAIIAGVTVSVQGLAAGRNGNRLTPAQMRAILSDGGNGSRSATPASDKIGPMPSLRKIVRQVIYPVGDFPLPSGDTRYAGRPIVVIDPGHGGMRPSGGSSPFGIQGPRMAEKDVTLALGRRVAQRIGCHVPVAMTREVDANVSLGERAAMARSNNAAVFLSIHADDATRGPRSDVWVHRTGGPRSRVLGQSVRDALADRQHARLASAPMAVLEPSAHALDTAACMVEVGDYGLSTESYGAPYVEDVADAMARGVLRYLGVAAADETEDTSEDSHAGCQHDDAEPDDEPVGYSTALSTPPELADLLRYLRISYTQFAPYESDYFLTLTSMLIGAGTIRPPTLLDRTSFAAAVEDFQRAAGQTADGVPGEDTLWELQRAWAAGRNLATSRVTADRVSGSGGYDSFSLRDDIVSRYDAMRHDVVSAGGVITSAGSLRSLTATVTQSRSSKSMHYSGLALDLATDTGMTSTSQRYIITAEGRKWRLWCKSDSAPSQTLDAVIWRGGSTSTTSVTVNAFDFTAIAERHGFERISHRSGFPADYMSAEWWHFQCEAPLTPWISQFGIELLSLSRYDEAALRRHSGIWGNRKKIFKRDWW